ncbi:hypothetical protein RBG61_04670 [Paludicola sp. MB14-C6]|nr:hypothetical protein [Paludicola sp. MB14-C6]WMJ23967.1 hypothetical protein RBG61_04670 [Paludicola sp. MB14-C6]
MSDKNKKVSKKQSKQEQAMNNFTNSVVTDSYQNQPHNTKKEALGPNTKR